MNIYNVCRGSIWKRQIVAYNLKDAQTWVDNFMPGCTATFCYKL